MGDFDDLHALVETDPEKAWPLVLDFIRDQPNSAAGLDFLEDFVYEHDERFISRIEAAAMADPVIYHFVDQAYVGGVATARADAFYRLQQRLRARQDDLIDGPADEFD
ncbi:MAG: hypothetical protein AABZ33_07355 [Chloroflexota bacterium]